MPGVHEALQGLGQAHQPSGTIGQGVLVVENESKGFGDSDCGNGQVILSEFERWNSDKKSNEATNEGCSQYAGDKRQVQSYNLLHILGIQTGGLWRRDQC